MTVERSRRDPGRPRERGRQRLLDPFTVERPAPANLAPGDDALFAHEYRRSFGPTELHVLHDVQLTSDGAFIRGLRVVPEVEFMPGVVKLGPRYVLGSLRRRRRLLVEPGGRYIAAFNCWSGNNYFHWMCDVLPRLYLIRDLVAGSTLVLPASHDVPFVAKTLAPLAPGRVVFFDPAETVTLREVTVPGHVAVTGNYHEPTMRGLAALLCAALGVEAGAGGGRRIYVTRQKAAHRHVLNETDVVDLVRAYGFEIVANEDLSFEEQVELHAGTEALIGIIGANLTNIMFMPPGSSVLQLSRRDDAHNHCYYSLAAAAGVRFLYQHCDFEDTRPGDYWNLTVDLGLLEENLKQMLPVAA